MEAVGGVAQASYGLVGVLLVGTLLSIPLLLRPEAALLMAIVVLALMYPAAALLLPVVPVLLGARYGRIGGPYVAGLAPFQCK